MNSADTYPGWYIGHGKCMNFKLVYITFQPTDSNPNHKVITPPALSTNILTPSNVKCLYINFKQIFTKLAYDSQVRCFPKRIYKLRFAELN